MSKAMEIRSVAGFLLAVALASTMSCTLASAQDVQAYCAKVGDDDRVQPVPDALLPSARRMFEVSTEEADSYVQATTSVRCMNRAVWLCNHGANLVCEKADVSRDSPGAERFCKQNPNSIGVPLSATGHATVYDWKCVGRKARIIGQTTKVDARGFIAENWKQLSMIGPQSPPASSAAAAPLPTVSPSTPPATAVVPPAGSNTASNQANRWEGYTNTRYGVMIDYPADLFSIQPPSPDNAGREFTAAAAGARFHVYSHANAMSFSVQELQSEDALNIGDKAAVKTKGADWYQIVAAKETETILHRVLLSDGGAMVHRFEIAYPKTAATAFEPIVARMTKSFRVDPAIPEKAANAAGSPVPSEAKKPKTKELQKQPEANKPAWQRFDSIALGMRIPGYSGKTGVSAEVPANWTKSDMPEKNVIEFQGPEATGDDVLHVTIRAERRRSGMTLANMAKVLKTRLAANADSFGMRDERNAQVALRPAILLSLQYAGSDSPDLLFEDIAIVQAGELFYIIEFGAPEARYAASQNIFAHLIETFDFTK